MEKSPPKHSSHDRIGFRYYPDNLHYKESDLQAWLPELRALDAGWLVLETPVDRAIPEEFIHRLVAAGIQPVLQMHMPLTKLPDHDTFAVLVRAYASWGVQYIVPFDKPNVQQSWGSDGWVQQRLVDRFLDKFIPIAERICEAGMTPVFPGLEPGGHFWDIVFLRSALLGIKSRGHTRLLDNLVIGAYGYPAGRPLEWGAGGPDAWPEVRPYDTPEGQQDHIGFRIFEWYTAIAENILGRMPHVILLGTGVEPVDLDTHADTNFKIARLLTDDSEIPANVLAGCFPLVSAYKEHPNAKLAWFSPEGEHMPVVSRFREWLQGLMPQDTDELEQPARETSSPQDFKPIKHYLLLPHPRWGNPDWFIKVTRPFIKKYSPTTGYSIRESFYAQQVTIVGGVQVFPETLKTDLERAGCKVVQIDGSGTEIATRLAEL